MDRIPALEHLRLLLAVGEEAEAARFVRELQSADVDADALLAPVAAALLERDHCHLALELALEALGVDGHCAAAHQVRVDALAEMGDIDAACAAAQEWTDADPDCPDAFVALSWARLADYDDRSAADAAARARDLDPGAVGGWLALAYVSRLGQNWETLQLYCIQALERDPDNVDARVFLGEALLACGRTVEASNVLRGLDDPRARAALRHHRLRQMTLAAGFCLVSGLLLVGLIQSSFGVVLGASVALGLFGRRIARMAPSSAQARGFARVLLHPLALWGLVGLVAVTVLRSLV